MSNVVNIGTYKPDVNRSHHNSSVIRKYNIERKAKYNPNNIVRASPLFRNIFVKKIVQLCKSTRLRVRFELSITSDNVSMVVVESSTATWYFEEPSEAWTFLSGIVSTTKKG